MDLQPPKGNGGGKQIIRPRLSITNKYSPKFSFFL